ncbi:unnamed protein product [Prunus armeniaca]
MAQDLDDLDEVRLGALDRLKAQKEAVARAYNKRTKFWGRRFSMEDHSSSGIKGFKIWQVVSNLGRPISRPPSLGEGGLTS